MNKKTFKNKRKAFSLIELSIVLIIIGLLVAGVTGGASLIRNAELRGVMTEARGYQVAVQSFFTKFNAIPGDFDQAIGAAPAGDNDGLIMYYDLAGTAFEANNALRHLISGDFIDDNGITPTTIASATLLDAAVVFAPGTNIPEAKIDNIGWMFGNDGTSNYAILTGAVTIGATGTATASATAYASDDISTSVDAVSGQDALSMDTKLDDGNPAAGSVVGIDGCTASYTLTDDTVDCTLGFNIDPTTN